MNLEYLAVSNAHGWCRHSDYNTAIAGALSYSSYVSKGDEVEITVYCVEEGTQFSNRGQFYVQEDDENRAPEKCEEESTFDFKYLGGDSMGPWNWKKVGISYPE